MNKASESKQDTSKTVPNTDMQPEDSGTADSGNTPKPSTPTERAMKQTSKTPSERGDNS